MKKNPTLIIFVLILGVFVSACTNSTAAPAATATLQPAATQTLPPSKGGDCKISADWELDFVVSGGIAGINRSLTISSDGHLVTQDLRKNEKSESTLAQSEIANITELLTQACPFTAKRSLGSCADCFNYTLDVFTNGTKYSLQANELSIPDNAAPLVELLGGYITK